MAIGAKPRYLEEQRLGGGYGDAVDGGADFEKNGNISTNGDITLKGVLSVGSTPQALTIAAGNLDGSTIQSGTINAAKLNSTDDYTMNSLTLTDNEFSIDEVKHYYENAITSNLSNKVICSIDIGAASNFGGVAMNVRVSGKTFNTTDLGMRQAYIAITKDGTPNYSSAISTLARAIRRFPSSFATWAPTFTKSGRWADPLSTSLSNTRYWAARIRISRC